MVYAGFRINEASVLKWSDVDFDNGVIYLYRSKVSNDDFIPMTNRLRACPWRNANYRLNTDT